MPHTLGHRIVRFVRAVVGLRDRREAQALVLYLGGAWLSYQFVSLLVLTFELPLVVVRVALVVLILGALGVLPLARWYEMVAREVDGRGTRPEDVPGVPDFLEGIFAGLHRRVGLRTAIVAGTLAAVGFSAAVLLLRSHWTDQHVAVAADQGISVAVFPFTTAGIDDPIFGEAVADLLAATLDGTPGIRVADPTTLWQPLRAGIGAPARSPTGADIDRVGRDFGIVRAVTGSVVRTGDRLNLVARVSGGGATSSREALTANVREDSLSVAVRRLAIDVVATVWPRDHLPTVPEIERFATSDPDALKAYLEAKTWARRGDYERAQQSIERAVALDSTFALAHLEQFSIRSWILWQNNEPFVGLRDILERAERHQQRLTPRSRFRVQAAMAMDDTDGVLAEFLLRRILAIDSLDVDALHNLAFLYLRDGWQMGKDLDEVAAAYQRVLAVDPASTVVRVTLARVAFLRDDLEEAGRQLDLVRPEDTTTIYVAGVTGSYRALRASGEERDAVLRRLAARPAPEVFSVIRDLKGIRPDLADRFLQELQADTMPVFHQRIGGGASVQLAVGQGRLRLVDSLVVTGALEAIRPTVNRMLIAADLAGVGDPEIAARAASELAEYAPADSLAAFLDHRAQVWATGWAVGGYHAAVGDTLEARVWQRALSGLPRGGTRWDWTGSLAADIEARLAVRRGDLTTAAQEAQRAYDLWLIHPPGFVLEGDPEPGIRFHLAEVRGLLGDDDRAEPLYRSFCPLSGWLGFYTARSALELARIRGARGHEADAAYYSRMAVRLWEEGDREIVDPWLERARAELGGR